MILWLRLLLVCWLCTFAHATTTTLCTALSPFVTSMNSAVKSLGLTASCSAQGDWAAKVSLAGDVKVLGYDFGNFGLSMQMEPCRSSPSIDFSATISGTAQEIASVVYNQPTLVPIPGLSVAGVASLDLSVTLSGTISDTTLKLGLALVVSGATLTTVSLTGSSGIQFSMGEYECPACAYLAGNAISVPATIAGLPCPAIYGLAGGIVVIVVALLGVSCCACCKTCCFKRRLAVAQPYGLGVMANIEAYAHNANDNIKVRYEMHTRPLMNVI
jgi:hypothetical protein